MSAARYIHLTPEQDRKLREIEQNQYLRPKVRFRAQVLRLSHRGFTVEAIASYSGRGRTSVLHDFDRWNQHNYEGLVDATAPGQPERITAKMRTHLPQRLQEQRTWTASQLADDLDENYGVRVTPEAIRLRSRELGYSWKRTRYLPFKQVDPEVLLEHKAGLDTLKRGLSKDA